jgi:hypothetical protein
MMAHATWSDAWRDTGHWAFNVLEAQLGAEWPATVTAKSPTGGAPQLAWAVGHVVAYAQVLELALRLELLRGVDGHAKIRRALRTDPRPPQLAHCDMQLEVAGLALMSGFTPALEPAPLSGRPADVSIPLDDRPLVVETRAILTSDDWREGNDWTDQVFERIRHIETRHGVRCQGTISRIFDAEDTEALIQEIETRARLVAAGLEAPHLSLAAANIEVVPQTQRPPLGLEGPKLGGDSWARIAPRIRQKAAAAAESGANWLRLDARDGLWQFTEWATRPLGVKLEEFETAVRGVLGQLDGIVVSCGSVLAQGDFDDEDALLSPQLAAVRKRLPFSRVRETLVIARDAGAIPAAKSWVQFYSAEPSWVDWALAPIVQ